jgi:hypothetical protein
LKQLAFAGSTSSKLTYVDSLIKSSTSLDSAAAYPAYSSNFMIPAMIVILVV